jgi:hypothetical protein
VRRAAASLTVVAERALSTATLLQGILLN